MKFELTPAVVGWALVFSLPPGLGATLAVNGLTNQPITSPDALTVGGGVAAVLFALVVVVAGVVPDEDPDGDPHEASNEDPHEDPHEAPNEDPDGDPHEASNEDPHGDPHEASNEDPHGDSNETPNEDPDE